MKESVLFIIFNRPAPTARVFNAIRNYKPERLYVAADGPRMDRTDENIRCQAARQLINVDWDCEVKYLYRESNLGCRLAVSSAITWFFQNEERGIILEDDCLPQETFFLFCEDMLTRYNTDKRVTHIGGYSAQNEHKRGAYPYFFMRYYHVWGWATWRRSWDEYDLEMVGYEKFKHDNKIETISANRKVQEYWLKLFDHVKNGEIDTWDYQWVYTNFIRSNLAICPNVNLIENIGFGIDATHTTGTPILQKEVGIYQSSENCPPVVPCVKAENYLYGSIIRSTSIWKIFRAMVGRIVKVQKI